MVEEVVDRKVEWRYVGLALLLTALMFTGIFLLGQSLSKYKVNNLQNDISELETEQRSTFLTYRLANELDGERCSAQRILTQQNLDDLYQVRRKVVQHQNSRKIEDPRFQRLKKQYLTILLDNYIQRQSLEENCNSSKVKILYMYSDKCKSCEGQGEILTRLRKSYDGQVLVYPIDADFQLRPIDFLKRFYSVDSYPTLVIEGEVHRSFMSMDELEREVDSRLNSTVGNRSSTGGR